MTGTTAWRRLQRLEEGGAIKARVALLDRRVLGLNVIVFAEVKLSTTGREALAVFEKAIQRFPEVLDCYTVMGEKDFLLRIVVPLSIPAIGTACATSPCSTSSKFATRKISQTAVSMAGMLARLDGAQFRRLHRSHIVNLDHVAKLLPWFGGDSLVMMSDGGRLTLSRNHRVAMRGFA